MTVNHRPCDTSGNIPTDIIRIFAGSQCRYRLLSDYTEPSHVDLRLDPVLTRHFVESPLGPGSLARAERDDSDAEIYAEDEPADSTNQRQCAYLSGS